MTERIADYFVQLFAGKLSGEIIAFIVSLLPVSELRGGMIVAKLMDIPFLRAFIICFVANMIPVPFILLFIRRLFRLLKKNKRIRMFIEKIESRGIEKGEKVKKYSLFGLFLLVAVPLPGTGAWTGALVAALLDIRMKHSLPVIALGVLTAGLIMSALTYGLFSFA